jgi:hypothetical protein
VGGTCGANGAEEERVSVIDGKIRRKATTRKTKIGGRIILTWIMERQDGMG